MRKTLAGLVCVFSAVNLHAATPVFYVTPLIAGQSSLITGETGSAVYQITNNSRYTLSTVGLTRMPGGVSANTGSVSSLSQYCSNPFSLAPGASCLLKVNMDSTVLGTHLQGGPIVCSTPNRPVYCSQPLNTDQLNLTISKGAIPQDCNSNVANFDYTLLQNFDSTDALKFSDGWGPARNALSLSPSNPDLTNCPVTAGVSWMQQRVVAAAEFWVKQKLNYCHHYNPDYATPLDKRNVAGTKGGFCNPAVDTMPGSYYYGKQARWNYSGSGSETMEQWVNNNRMWYGMDCSNTTSFIYNFAFGTNSTLGIPFNSETQYQAGQTSTQPNLSPNQQVPGDASKILSNAEAAGLLVCADGTTDPTPLTPTMCTGHGGYLSRIASDGKFNLNVTVADLIKVLQPGDLLFIAGRGGPDPQPDPDGGTSEVTHVIMWLGKQVGYGKNDINPALIAPNDKPCADPDLWTPNVGDWVIVDSHYQGYDYRILIQCFYVNDLWGVRRVIR